MKTWIACAGALLLAAACGTNQNALAALKAMSLEEGNSSKVLAYKGKSGSGDKVTLNDVRLGGPADADAMIAKTMELGGLDVTKDGKPIVKSIILRGIGPQKAAADGSKVGIDSIGIEGLNPETGVFVASMLKNGEPTEPPPPFEQWQFSKISLNGLNFSANASDAGESGTVNVQLGEFSISDLKNTLFGSAKLAGFKGAFDIKGSAPFKGTFDLGTTEVKNLRGKIFSSVAEAVIASMFDPGSSATLADGIAKAFTSPLEPGFDQLTSTGMNFESEGVKLAISRIEEKATRDANGVVTALSTPRSTITFSASSAGGQLGQQATMALAAAGYPSTTIELYASGGATFDPAKDLTRYTNYQMGVTNGLDVQMSAGLIGLHKAIPQMIGAMASSVMQMLPALMEMQDQPAPGPDGAPATPATPAMPNMDAAIAGMTVTALSSLMEVKVSDLDLAVTDKSLVGYMIAQSAKEAKRPADAYRQDLANMITSSTTDMTNGGLDAAMAKELTSALAGFVKGPGTLHIALKPKEPVGLETLMGSAVSKDTLGFSASFAPSAK
jgi:hypothetical protein